MMTLEEINAWTEADDCYSSMYEGEMVTTPGYVTAIVGSGFFIQSTPVGMPYGGIYVHGDYPSDMMVGQFVHVSGEVVEYWGLSEIVLDSDNAMHGVLTLYEDDAMVMGAIEPTPTSTGSIGEDCNEMGEMHEGLLVTVYNVMIT